MQKGFKILAILGCIVLLLGLTLEMVEAATARVRCRVKGQRVRIQVDGQDLEPGIYRAVVTNLNTGAVAITEEGKEAEATELEPDVDLDFDSTADPDDNDSFIPANFARAGHRVQAEVENVDTGEVAASASTTCRRK